MSIESGTPVSTVVMAIDLVNEANVPPQIVSDLQRTLIGVVGFSAELQVLERGYRETSFLLVFQPEAAMQALLHMIFVGLEEFERSNDIETRLVVHHGLVFSQFDSNRMLYVGSALRTLQSCLQRASPRKMRVVTQAFARIAQSWSNSNLSIRKGHEPLMSFEFAVSEAKQVKDGGSRNKVSLSQSQLNEIGSRLAQYIGPLAMALVTDFSRQSTTALNLVRSLGREIGDPKERRRFEEDMQYFLEAWYKPQG